uniref:Uncharacterized protein n=2 Tax=unclassified Caudoviricetes TaxID=2788787 RepID=A0A8S5PDH1_9CAUD|nr:MAG TPA: hypothetical protein [Caudovirales sp. ctbaM10]DAE15775.1 MAG TPA: hypothetical protein [Caudovirales sp. ctIyl37]
MVYCRCESWETSQEVNKERTPNVLGVLLHYAGLINIIIGGTYSLGKCDPFK